MLNFLDTGLIYPDRERRQHWIFGLTKSWNYPETKEGKINNTSLIIYSVLAPYFRNDYWQLCERDIGNSTPGNVDWGDAERNRSEIPGK